MRGAVRSNCMRRGSPIPSAPIRSPRATPPQRARQRQPLSLRRRVADAPPSLPVADQSHISPLAAQSRRHAVAHPSRNRRAPVAPVSRSCRVPGRSRVSSRPLGPQPAWFRQLRRKVSGATLRFHERRAVAPPRSAACATALRVMPRRLPRSPRR